MQPVPLAEVLRSAVPPAYVPGRVNPEDRLWAAALPCSCCAAPAGSLEYIAYRAPAPRSGYQPVFVCRQCGHAEAP